jgi:AcrR family transcriptional regulator
MSLSRLAEPGYSGSLSLRNEPVQARSTARLAALLDAAAAVIDELGYERLTTAMVAERAGASIGTVYRYFPDRIAVLQALATRNLERTLERVISEIKNPAHENWVSALEAGLSIFVEAFRNEPGFRSLRVGDVVDLRPTPTERTYNSIVADRIREALVERFDLPNDDKTKFLFECAVEVSDAMAARAFTFDPNGEVAFLDAGKDLVRSLLSSHLGEPTASR